MSIGAYIGIGLGGLLAAFLFVLVLRTLACGLRRRRPAVPERHLPIAECDAYAKRLATLIQCPTVSSKEGHDDVPFAQFRERLRGLFPLIHEHLQFQSFGDGCLVYRCAGRDDGRNIIVMSHHDVVATDGQDWKRPPFSGDIVDGKLWGRGTVDTKTPLFAEMQAVEELLAEGFRPAVNVWIASSCNEEVSGNGIPLFVRWCEEQGLSFELVLDEGGAIIQNAMPTVSEKFAMLAVHEKGRCCMTCKASDELGHFGLSPKGDAPVIRMAKFIAEVDRSKPFIKRLYPQVRATFGAVAPHMAFPLRLVFSNLWCFWPILKRVLPSISAQAGTMLGTSCYFTGIQGGKYGHIQTKDCTATAFLRCIDADDLARDIATLRSIARKYQITVEPTGENEAYVPADMALPPYGYVVGKVREIFPHAGVAPFVLPAGSDARHLTKLCPCVIRFAPIDIDPQQFSSVHSADENISVQAVGDAVAFYREVLRGYR